MISTKEQGVWDEELLCFVQCEQRTRSFGMTGHSSGLRRDISARNIMRARASMTSYQLTEGSIPSVIYTAASSSAHGNFITPSYLRIEACKEWRTRLHKAHTAKRQARPVGKEEIVHDWKELDAATSSDALLMNIFCYPRVMNKKLCSLMGVEPSDTPQFGYKSRMLLKNNHFDRTEFDMKLGRVLVEAKLTESGFQRAPLRLLERYPKFEETFDAELLDMSGGIVESYQLLRGIMAAQAEDMIYCVVLDSRRPDLFERCFQVIRAVRSYDLQSRLRVVTWQEISAAVPKTLQKHLSDKYGISSRMLRSHGGREMHDDA